jgi:RES domain-containing protein
LIQAWRLCQAAHIATAFNGDGARLYGGRWNNKGQPVIYTASSLSLAALEVLAHADTDLVPNDFFSFAVSIPDDKIVVERLDPNKLSADWRVQYPPLSCQQAGNEWLAHGKSAILSVPSVLIPGEWNFLLNPTHKDFKRCVVSPPQPFQFDSRLWG